MTYAVKLSNNIRKLFPDISSEIIETITENWCPYEVFGGNTPYEDNGKCCNDCNKCWYRRSVVG